MLTPDPDPVPVELVPDRPGDISSDTVTCDLSTAPCRTLGECWGHTVRSVPNVFGPERPAAARRAILELAAAREARSLARWEDEASLARVRRAEAVRATYWEHTYPGLDL